MIDQPASSMNTEKARQAVQDLEYKLVKLTHELGDVRRSAHQDREQLCLELDQARQSDAAAKKRVEELKKALLREQQRQYGGEENVAEMHAQLARAETEVARLRREVSATRREAQQQAKAAEQRSEEAAREATAVSLAALALQETEAAKHAKEGGLVAKLHLRVGVDAM